MQQPWRSSRSLSGVLLLILRYLQIFKNIKDVISGVMHCKPSQRRPIAGCCHLAIYNGMILEALPTRTENLMRLAATVFRNATMVASCDKETGTVEAKQYQVNVNRLEFRDNYSATSNNMKML